MVLVNSVYVIFSVSHFLAPWLLVNTILVTVIFYLKLQIPVTISTDRGLTLLVVGLSFMGKDAYRVDAFLIQGDIDDPLPIPHMGRVL